MKLGEDHLEFLSLLDAGELRPEVLPLSELHRRFSANPGLLRSVLDVEFWGCYTKAPSQSGRFE